jgi:hypothetical protein
VAGEGKLLEVDLNEGKVLRSVPFKGRIDALGFAGAGRAFVYTGRTVEVLDLATSRTLHSVTVNGKPSWFPSAAARVGEKLYVAEGTGLAVVDLDAGKVVGRLGTWAPRWSVFGLAVGASKAYVAGAFMGCGTFGDRLLEIDLKTGKTRDLPRKGGSLFGARLFAMLDGGLVHGSMQELVRHEAGGLLVGSKALAPGSAWWGSRAAWPSSPPGTR